MLTPPIPLTMDGLVAIVEYVLLAFGAGFLLHFLGGAIMPYFESVEITTQITDQTYVTTMARGETSVKYARAVHNELKTVIVHTITSAMQVHTNANETVPQSDN